MPTTWIVRPSATSSEYLLTATMKHRDQVYPFRSMSSHSNSVPLCDGLGEDFGIHWMLFWNSSNGSGNGSSSDGNNGSSVRFKLHMECVCGLDAFSVYKINNHQISSGVSPSRDILSTIFPQFPIHCCWVDGVSGDFPKRRRTSTPTRFIVSWNFAGYSKGSNLQIDRHIGVLLRWPDFPIVSDSFSVFAFYDVPKTNTNKHFMCLHETSATRS